MTARLRRVAAWAGVALLLGAVLALGGWRLHGGRWVRVETASMGTTAPVGSLLWVAPTRYADLRKGDLITFTPPGHDRTYSHLVRSVEPDGTLRTQGRITAPDPWRLGPEDVHGRVVMVWKGVGWLLLAAPVLLGGGLLVAALATWFPDRAARSSVALVGAALVIVAALVVYRPLTRAEQLGFEQVNGGARATYVSTGLVPVRLRAQGGNAVVLRDGEVGSVLAPAQRRSEDQARFEVAVSPQLPLGWQAALVGLCFVPVLVARSGGRGSRARHRARQNPRS